MTSIINTNFYKQITDTLSFRTLAHYFLRKQTYKPIKPGRLNKLYLYLEFITYHFPKTPLTKNFLSSCVKLFFRLSQQNIDNFFKKFKSTPEEEEHKILKLFNGAEIKKIVFSLEEILEKSFRRDDLPQVKILKKILENVPVGIIDYTIIKHINTLIAEKSLRGTGRQGYFSETNFLFFLGTHLLTLYFTVLDQKIMKKVSLYFTKILKGRSLENLPQEDLTEIFQILHNTFEKTLKLKEKDFTLFWILQKIEERNSTLNLKKRSEEIKKEKAELSVLFKLSAELRPLHENFKKYTLEEIQNQRPKKKSLSSYKFLIMPLLWEREIKPLLLKLGSIFFSFIKDKKINDNPLFFEKDFPKENDEGYKKIKMIKFNTEYFTPLFAKNLPYFNKSFNEYTNKRIKRITLNLFNYGKMVRVFKNKTTNENIFPTGISKENVKNIRFLNDFEYTLNKNYSDKFIKSLTTDWSLDFACIFYEKSLSFIKNNLQPYDLEKFISLCIRPEYNIIIINNQVYESKCAQNIKRLTKIDEGTAYQKYRNALFNEIQGKKILLKSVLMEYAYFESFSYIKTEKAYDKTNFLFPTFYDARNRLYRGNNLLSPMATNKYALFLKQSTNNIINNYFEKALELFEIVKDYKNYFSEELIELQNKTRFLYKKTFLRELIFNKFSEENQFWLAFIKKNNLETKNVELKDFIEIYGRGKKNINNKELFSDFSSFLNAKRFLKNSYYCFDHFYSLDVSSSGLQISGLLINSESLLNFSNILGHEKSAGYRAIYTQVTTSLNKLSSFWENEDDQKFFSYSSSYLIFVQKIKEDFPILKDFSFRELLFLIFVKKKEPYVFSRFLNLETIKKLCIASIYGLGRKGFEEKLKELEIETFSESMVNKLENSFREKEVYFRQFIPLHAKIHELYLEIEKIESFNFQIKPSVQPKYNRVIKTLENNINFYLSLLLFSENPLEKEKDKDKNEIMKLPLVEQIKIVKAADKKDFEKMYTKSIVKPDYNKKLKIKKAKIKKVKITKQNEELKDKNENPETNDKESKNKKPEKPVIEYSFKVYKKTEVNFYDLENKKMINCEAVSEKTFYVSFVRIISNILSIFIKKTPLTDSFAILAPVFQNLVNIKKIRKCQLPFIVQHDNFSFEIKYPENERKTVNIRKMSFQDGGFRLQKTRSKISIKLSTEKINYSRMSLGLPANFIQSYDAVILNNFVSTCRKINVPCYVQHDKVGVPYPLFLFLKPMMCEAILTVDWENALLNFCNNNGLILFELKTLQDVMVFRIQLKILNLLFPEKFLKVLTKLAKIRKKIKTTKSSEKNENENASSELSEEFLLKEANSLLEQAKIIKDSCKNNFNYRQRFTNPYFIK